MAEGDGSLNRYTLFWVSRVRIPSSPYLSFSLPPYSKTHSIFSLQSGTEKHKYGTNREGKEKTNIEMTWDENRLNENMNNFMFEQPGGEEREVLERRVQNFREVTESHFGARPRLSVFPIFLTHSLKLSFQLIVRDPKLKIRENAG